MGLNNISCFIGNPNEYEIINVFLPDFVIGKDVINKTKFNITVDFENPGIKNFCPTIEYLDKDKKKYEEKSCFNFKVVKPDFNINITTSKNVLYKDKINKITICINSNKKLDDLKINVDGEIIGNNHFNGIKCFDVLIKPELKNYIILNLNWKYNEIEYNKSFLVLFDVIDKIENDQLYIFYDNSSNIIGVANRGNSKLYHCVLNLIQNGKIVKTKYIGDLDEDDYDSTIIKGFSGEIHVLCYDKNHNNISKYDKIYIPKEIKKETNILILFFIVLILIILVFAIKKFVEKQKRKQ